MGESCYCYSHVGESCYCYSHVGESCYCDSLVGGELLLLRMVGVGVNGALHAKSQGGGGAGCVGGYWAVSGGEEQVV